MPRRMKRGKKMNINTYLSRFYAHCIAPFNVKFIFISLRQNAEKKKTEISSHEMVLFTIDSIVFIQFCCIEKCDHLRQGNLCLNGEDLFTAVCLLEMRNSRKSKRTNKCMTTQTKIECQCKQRICDLTNFEPQNICH